MNNDDLVRIIPKNALKSGKFLGFHWRYWVESILFSGSAGYFIFSTNLVLRIKIICMSVICLTLFVFFMRGIKNRPVIQFLTDVIIYLKSKKQYHLGSVSDERTTKENYKFGGESFLERVIRSTKTKAKAFDEKYGK